MMWWLFYPLGVGACLLGALISAVDYAAQCRLTSRTPSWDGGFDHTSVPYGGGFPLPGVLAVAVFWPLVVAVLAVLFVAMGVSWVLGGVWLRMVDARVAQQNPDRDEPQYAAEHDNM